MELFAREKYRLGAYASSVSFFVRVMNMDLSVRKLHSFIARAKATRKRMASCQSNMGIDGYWSDGFNPGERFSSCLIYAER